MPLGFGEGEYPGLLVALFQGVDDLLLEVLEGTFEDVVRHVLGQDDFLVDDHGEIVDVVQDLVVALFVLLEVHQTVVD